ALAPSSLPLHDALPIFGLSINNAFGRLWPANAPTGLDGIGTSTILDPTGIPLAGAPNPQAGGVFAGDLTPRLPTHVFPGALDRRSEEYTSELQSLTNLV